jgi:hypothetical protein
MTVVFLQEIDVYIKNHYVYLTRKNWFQLLVVYFNHYYQQVVLFKSLLLFKQVILERRVCILSDPPS